MKQSVRLGRVGGIPVGAHWSVAVILVIMAQVLAVSVLPSAHPHERSAVYWTVAVITAVLFVASLLAHELAHALVARHSGVTVRSVTLWMLGGVTEFEGEPPTAAADFRIALAGPAASLAAGGICYGLGAVIVAAGIAEAFTYRSAGGSLDGLWLMLIGWFLITAAAAETRSSAARTALAGVRVADVMTPHPELVSGRDSVSEFIDGAARSRQDAFPVIGSDGELTGIVLTSQVDDIPDIEWVSRRVDEISPAVPPAYRAAPGDPAAPLASRTPLGGQIAAVVLDHGRVIGMVTVSDLQQAVLRRQRLTTRR